MLTRSRVRCCIVTTTVTSYFNSYRLGPTSRQRTITRQQTCIKFSDRLTAKSESTEAQTSPYECTDHTSDGHFLSIYDYLLHNKPYGTAMVKNSGTGRTRLTALTAALQNGKLQEAQLSQRDRAPGCVIVFAKSRRLEQENNILRTL